MTQKDGFGSGFIAGSIVGGIVGGFLGAILASRQSQSSQETEEQQSFLKPGQEPNLIADESIEIARRSLEAKIAQLNLAIDDVREQLGGVDRDSSDEV